MPYVIQTYPGGHRILYQMSERELADTREEWEPKGFAFQRVSASYAHRWIKNGEIHGTDLWVDHKGRIRRSIGED